MNSDNHNFATIAHNSLLSLISKLILQLENIKISVPIIDNSINTIIPSALAVIEDYKYGFLTKSKPTAAPSKSGVDLLE